MRIHRRLLFVLLFLTALGTIGFLGLRALAAARWDEMLASADAIEESFDAIETKRPVLYGEATEGNAFDDYGAAMALVQKDDDDRWQAIQAARRAKQGEQVRELRDSYLADHAELLGHLRAGARRSHARRDVDWSRGFSMAIPNLLETRNVANLCVLRAEQELDAGRPTSAAGWLLDAAQFGRDHAVGAIFIERMIGVAMVEIATREALVKRHMLDRFPAAGLATLADGLRILDENWAFDRRGLDGELLGFARTMQLSNQGGAFQGTGLSWWHGWRYGFSTNLMAAASFQVRKRDADELAGLEAWDERSAVIDRQTADQVRSANPMTRLCAPSLGTMERSLRAARARLRMLRMAVEYRLTGSCTPLADPFGGRLSFEVDGDTLRLASRGADGTPGKDEVVEIAVSPAWTERK